MLHIWHTDKNFFTKCKSLFHIDKVLKIFCNDLNKILYANKEPKFNKKWTNFELKYDTKYLVSIQYFCNDLIAI